MEGLGTAQSSPISISHVGIVRMHINFTHEALRSLMKEPSRQAVARVRTTKMERKKECLEAPIKFNVSNKWTISKRLA